MQAPIPTVPAKTDRGSWSVVLGSIDGHEVTGTYYGRELMFIGITFQGMKIEVDAPDRLSMAIGQGLGCVGAMRVSEWRVLERVAKLGLVDQLIELFKRYQVALGGQNCEYCGAKLQPADEGLECGRCATVRHLTLYAQMPGANLGRLAGRLGA